MYLEYRGPQYSGWCSYGGRVNPGRHYGVFAKLADVRNQENWGIKPLEARGFPEDSSYAAKGDNYMYICSDNSDNYDNACTREQAERWVKHGSNYIGEDKKFVSHPDWHSHSWVTSKELKEALEDPNVQYEPKEDPGYAALLAQMEKYEELGFETRVVFWFDN
jgi:hypothetical protein